MKHRHAQLFLLAGLWVSFVGFTMGVSTLIPPTKELAAGSPALLYKVALNEELRNPINITLPEAGKTLVADLGHMELSAYENGTLMKTYAILSRGKAGTFWETPTGSYAIQAKEPKHFSSIGGTWMPYSMQFYGNFFIHGWPTYPDGSAVPQGYSGGCIRLSTDDARELYAFAAQGTRLFVTGGAPKDPVATSSRYYLRGEGGKPPPVSAPSFVVADIDSGAILWERSAGALTKPGGLSALPTALTALETVDQYKVVRLSELLLGEGVLRKHSIGAADELPGGTLIYPLLFDANDTAAKVFEREHGTKRFVASMNEKAGAIGMSHTQFGGALSSDESTTTARDLFTLLSYVDQSKHFLIDASLAPDQAFVDNSGDEEYRWENKNPWIQSGDGMYRGGVASVESDGSGGAMVIFALPLAEFGTRRIAFIVPHSAHLEEDIAALKQFVGEHYTYGAEREGGSLIREQNDPTPSLLERAKALLDLGNFLQDEVSYERDA